LSLRKRHARAVPGAGRGRRALLAVARDAPLRRDDRRARDHFARCRDDPAERARVARQAVPPGVESRPIPPTPRSHSMPSFTRRRALATLAASPLALAVPAWAQGKEPLRIGFIYVSPIGDAGWTHQHDIARIAMEKSLAPRVTTK